MTLGQLAGGVKDYFWGNGPEHDRRGRSVTGALEFQFLLFFVILIFPSLQIGQRYKSDYE
jgi:hypothetical protein